jgi:hypothetical protein
LDGSKPVAIKLTKNTFPARKLKMLDRKKMVPFRTQDLSMHMGSGGLDKNLASWLYSAGKRGQQSREIGYMFVDVPKSDDVSQTISPQPLADRFETVPPNRKMQSVFPWVIDSRCLAQIRLRSPAYVKENAIVCTEIHKIFAWLQL